MAVRAILGFEHLPQGDTSWINYATHGLTRAADQSAQNTIVNGWIVSNSTTAGAERLTLPLTPYMAAPVGKIWFAVRVRVVNNVNGAAGMIFFNAVNLLTVSSIPGVVNGTIAHLEFSYEMSTGIIERWINGVQIANTSTTANLRTATFGLEAKGTTANRLDWRDIFVCDDQGRELGLPIGPLGSQSATPIGIDSADGADWTTTPSGATLLEALGEIAVVPTAKIATSALTKGPLVASLKSSIAAGATVTAIELMAGSSSNGGQAATVSTKLTHNGNNQIGQTLQAPLGSYNYNASLGVFHRNPSGGMWDTASVDATTVTLSPDS